jgi:hypothetical protein
VVGASFHAGLGVGTITGTNAADSISAMGGGRDTIDARGGDDSIGVRDSELDPVACGQGTDSVNVDTGLDLMTGCERVVQVAHEQRHAADRLPGARVAPAQAHARDAAGVGADRLRRKGEHADRDQRVGEISIRPRDERITREGRSPCCGAPAGSPRRARRCARTCA